MIRNYKALGIALTAMLALSAFAAQAASASPLTPTGADATLFTTGDQDGAGIVFSNPAHAGK